MADSSLYSYIFKGDDTAAFGNSLLKINAKIPDGQTVTKAEVRIGDLPVMTFKNPEFPLFINLSPAQSSLLSTQNEVYMAVYDGEGRKKTCYKKARIIARERVI